MSLRLWSIPPFAVVLGCLVYLWSKYAELPEKYPVHWGFSGQADGWVEKSVVSLLTPALVGLGVMALITANAWLFEKSPKEERRAAAPWMVGLLWALGWLFALVVLLPVMTTSVWMILMPVVVIVGLAIKMSIHTSRGAVAPRECWKMGIFYFNPEDPDLMVEKRNGLGYTLNFAHRASWWIMGGLLVLVLAPFLLMRG